MISRSILATAAVAFIAGALYTRLTARSAHSDKKQLEQSLALTLANRNALKQVSQAYRTNLKTFQGIRLEVEVGLRHRIDSLKNQLDDIEESLRLSEESHEHAQAGSDEDDSWLLDNVKDVPITLRPEFLSVAESEDDQAIAKPTLSFNEEMHILADHAIINNLSPEILIHAIEDLLLCQLNTRQIALSTIFSSLLARAHQVDVDAIREFWMRYRMVFSYFIEDTDDIALFVASLQVCFFLVFSDAKDSVHSDSLIHLHYTLLLNNSDTPLALTKSTNLHSPTAACQEKPKNAHRRVSFHPDTRLESLDSQYDIDLQFCTDHALSTVDSDDSFDIDPDFHVDDLIYNRNRDISLSIVNGTQADAQTQKKKDLERSMNEFTSFVGTVFTEIDWFEQRSQEVYESMDENVFNVAKCSHSRRRILKKRQC